MEETVGTPSGLLTVAEAAQRCRVSRTTMWRLVRAGVVPALRVGTAEKGPIRVPADELDAWIAERRAESAVGPGSSAGSCIVRAVGTDSSVDTPAERDGTSSSREAVEPAQLAGGKR